ncbi:hypothetical protein GH741_16030 [Aquibacillus halophilus]|uniref:Uncharacterized protein n=1 Tax=Aquibacillus halophilus TaxID=930132 RepID=A0A6A8DK49_9BACI|nr:hypothetical protein [Aquibacillus halophilus]
MIRIKKDTFLFEVIKQIKSKKAKNDIKAELEYHLYNSKSNWMEKGFSEEEAERKAVQGMGNPTLLGNEFNNIHSPWYIYFLKLNVVSFLYACMVMFPIQLMANEYRISRITDLHIDTVKSFVTLVIPFALLLGTIFLLLLTKKWLRKRKANFWTIILWVPYWVLIISLMTLFFPMAHAADDPGIGIGIIAGGAMIAFPVYILIINLISYVSNNKVKINR